MNKLITNGPARPERSAPAAPARRGNGTSGSPAPADERLLELSYLDADAVLEALGTARNGLTEDEVEARRERFGRNEVAHEKPPTWYAELARAFANPFNFLLTTLAIVSGVTGDQEAMTVIGIMVLFSTGLRFVQEFRSNKSAQALRALVRTSTAVEREGDEFVPGTSPAMRRREIPMDELVPGDIVYLSAGDMIPADVRLISAKDLFVAQSALTGEAIPVEKMDRAVPPPTPPALTEVPTICFMGTSVVSGTATAAVVATGSNTSFGRMAKGLVGRRVETAFDVGVRKVSWLFIRFIAVMVPIVFLINGLTKGSWLEAFLFGLAVAVGLTPEMLPMIVTTNLAKGAVTMARHKTIVKRLNSIQNFGAMDVLCTDKTGTLTQDKVVLERHVNVVGEEDDFVLALAYLNSFYQTGLKNLLDVAVLEHGELKGQLAIDKAYGKIDECPFDFTRRRMSVVVDHEHRDHQLICKGAVEEILAVCRYVRDEPLPGESERIVALEDERREDAMALVAEMNEDGFRVVAVAYRDFPISHGPYTVADECDLTLAGFIGFLDPPKETAAPALHALGEHGISVKILTGDNDLVTRKICRDVGIDAEHIVLGSELRTLDDEAVGLLASNNGVFAKLTPDDKTRIVRALKARGHTVGFLGDGINDAGALREADVGVSVDSAVDIAKESADIILLEKSLLGARGGRDRRTKDLRQYDQVHQDDGELELRERVQRPHRERVSAVSPDAPDSTLDQQSVIRLLTDVDPVGRHGSGVPARAAPVACRRHRAVHGVHRPDQLDLRHRHVPRHVVRLPRERAGASVAVSVRVVHRVTAYANAHRAHDPDGEGALCAEPCRVAGAPAHRPRSWDVVCCCRSSRSARNSSSSPYPAATSLGSP